DRRKLCEDCGDAIAPFAVELVMAVEKDRLRAELCGGAQRHRGVNAEAPRFIACRGHDSTLVALAAYHDGQAAEFWTRQQLDGNKERVHINVQNRSAGISRGAMRGIALSSELGQFRHGGLSE